VSPLAAQLGAAFGNVKTPSFDKLLKPALYEREDCEPIVVLSELYPFDNILLENEALIDEVVLHLSTEGRLFLFPKLFQYFLNNPESETSNLFSSVATLVNDYPLKRPKRPTRDWLASMTPKQQLVINAAVFELFGFKKADVS